MTKLKAATLAFTLTIVPAKADTLSVGFFDPASGQGLQTIAANSTSSPISFGPLFLGSGFGFGNISALLGPTAPGNQAPTFEFAFHNGFVPPQGGTIYLFATWQGPNLSNNAITMPTSFAADEMPGGANGLYVAEQIFTAPINCVYCDNFINPQGKFAGGTQFTDVLDIQNTTLTTIAPGQFFSITEEFVFGNNASWNGVVQGDVGGYILTTPLAAVPGPIVGAGVPGLVGLALLAIARLRRRWRNA
jgi:hypothetical protein